MSELNKIINEEIIRLTEEFNRSDYLKWRRNNVTYRGINELGKDNGTYGSWGRGLYTVPLSNKSMAKEYGKVYFVVGAIPQKPKIIHGINDAEILRQTLVFDFCKINNCEREYDPTYFENNTSIEKEMQKLGYDGLIIKGRELVNYQPNNDEIKYFENEDQLIRYYQHTVAN